MNSHGTLTAVFDGQCVICRATERMVKRLDWRERVRFVNLHDEAAFARLSGLTHDDAMGQIHVLDDHGRVFAGFRGTRRMLRELPLTFPLWLVLHLPGMTWLGARIYGFIARHRYAVNRRFGGPACDDGICRM